MKRISKRRCFSKCFGNNKSDKRILKTNTYLVANKNDNCKDIIHKMAHVSSSRVINNREIILDFIDKDFLFLLERVQKIKILKNEYFTIIINVHKMAHVSFSCTINNRDVISCFIDKDFLFLLERVQKIKI